MLLLEDLFQNFPQNIIFTHTYRRGGNQSLIFNIFICNFLGASDLYRLLCPCRVRLTYWATFTLQKTCFGNMPVGRHIIIVIIFYHKFISKWNFPLSPSVRPSVGWVICHNFLKGREFQCSLWEHIFTLLNFILLIFQLRGRGQWWRILSSIY